MNYRQAIPLTGFILMLVVNVCVAQQIDQTVARELGLVKTARPPMKSGVFDIALNVGKRLELVFPEQGKLDIKGKDLTKFEILNVNNSLFIKALEPLTEETTGIFTLRSSQRIIVLNFKTVKQEVVSSSRFIQPPDAVYQTNLPAATPAPPVPGPSRIRGVDYDDYVRITAFAARSAYAPDRLLNPPNGMRKVELKVKGKQLRRMSRESRLKLTPLSSWVFKGLHVTVVELENTGAEVLKLTADVLRGQFVARSFQHNRIGTQDNNRYSAAYVVSLVPFQQAIGAL